MPIGFQKYLIDKGFKRTCIKASDKVETEDYESLFLSSYNPLHYNFYKDEVYCFWGLVEKDKPAVMYLGANKIRVVQNNSNHRTKEDAYRILFSKWKEEMFDIIYDVLISKDKRIVVDCYKEDDIKIYIESA